LATQTEQDATSADEPGGESESTDKRDRKSGRVEKRDGKAKRGDRRERMTPALFFRQVVAELRKVIWPTRRELGTYTTVAVVFVLIMTVIVTGLDYGFTKLMFWLFS
jgi:preprotein translocase subunit SecE